MSANQNGAEDGRITDRIAYQPTQAELDAADDPSVHADYVELDVSLGDAHATVRERVEQLVEAAERNGVLQQITVEPVDGDYHSAAVNIQPLENWNEEGQLGFEKFHVLLGTAGGMAHARKYATMVDDSEYDDWNRLLRAVRSAN